MFSPTRDTLNLPDHLYEDYTQLQPPPWSFCSSGASSSSSAPVRTFDPVIAPPPNVALILRWITDLNSEVFKYTALEHLVKNRNRVEILPRLVWEAKGTVHRLLHEVTSVFKDVSQPFFNRAASLRVYNVFLLFQSIAHHPETRDSFLKAEMPHYFFPFMDVHHTDKSHECLRIGALGVIAHLLKGPVDEDATRFVMETGALRYCIRAVEIGSTESKTLGVFILQKIMSTDMGLKYCCVLPDRFYVTNDLLRRLLVSLSVIPRPSSTLFNITVACYARLSQHPRARDGLKRYTPVMLFDGTFARLLAEDPIAENYRRQLMENLA